MENSKIINKIVAMQPELMSFAFKLTANQDSANDLVQDSILDDDVVEVELFQQVDMIQSALHHRFRHRCAVLGEDVLFQTAAVDTDADGDIFLLAGIHDCLHAVIVADVARVDADLIHAHVSHATSLKQPGQWWRQPETKTLVRTPGPLAMS